MAEFLHGYAAFHWVATWSHPLLDRVFFLLTDLGNPLSYFLLIAPLFWVVDRRRALVLFLLLAVSGLVNSEAKLWFDTPRPDPEVIRVLDLRPIESGSRSFPSGHAQIALVFWLYLALWARRPWFTVLAVALAAAISFSRIYLGVHFPIDIAGGLALGAATLALVPWLERWRQADFAMPRPVVLAGMALSLGFVLWAKDPALVVALGCVLAFLVLGLVPQARVTLAGPRQAAVVVVAGLSLLVAAAALSSRLGLLSAHAGGALGLVVAALWLLALWAYPHAVALAFARRATAEESPAADGR